MTVRWNGFSIGRRPHTLDLRLTAKEEFQNEHPRKRLKNGRTSYEVKLRGPNGRQYSRSFRTRREAEAFEVPGTAYQVQRTWIDSSAGSVPLAVCRSVA